MTEILGSPLFAGYGWLVLPVLLLCVATATIWLISNLLKHYQQQALRNKKRWRGLLAATAIFPVGFLIAALAGWVVFRPAIVSANAKLLPIFDAVPWVVTVVALCGFCLQLIVKGFESNSGDNRDKQSDPEDRAFKLIFQRLAIVLLVVLATLLIFRALGVQLLGITLLLSALTLVGGIAARELLADLLSGLVLRIGKPFKAGDLLRSPDREIEGVVEHVGIRQTRLRKFDKQSLHVPNQLLNSITIENASRSTHRRFYEHIGVRFEDLEVIREIISEIRRMLIARKDIDCQQELLVSLDRFEESSAEILISAFSRTRDWVQFQGLRQDILLQVHDIIAAHGAEIPTPTRTLHVDANVRRLRGFNEDLVA